MPRSAGWSRFTTTSWWCLSPRASRVRRSRAGWPMPDRTCRMRSAPPPPFSPAGGSTGSRPGFRFRYFRVGGFLAMRRLLPRPVRDGLQLDAALLRHPLGRGEPLQRVERGAHHVVGIGRAEAFGEDVAHACALEHGAHRATRDHAGPGGGGLEQHPARAVVADDLVRDRPAGERDLHHVAARALHRLAHRLADLVRLARGDADVTLAVADGDEGVEAEAPSALHHLGDPVDRDHGLDQAVALLPLATVTALASAPPAPPSSTPPTSP